MSSPEVSVVMACFNASQTLDKAVESILEQTYRDFEFLIIDDGSTDDTVEKLKTWSERDVRIKLLFNNKNSGLAASLNKGIEASKGKFIARMDADDRAFERRLELQTAFWRRRTWRSPLTRIPRRTY